MDASRVWPSPDAYQNAVLSPRRFLRDVRLHAAQVESRFFLGSQRPNLRSGNFGAVYRFKGAHRSFALKVFYKADAERQQRYQLIDQHLAGQAASAHLVSFRYDEEGIQVHRRWYPTLVMDWAPGKTLDLYLQECRGEIRNGLFCQSLAHMVRELQVRGMAHGDLQHGNMLVQAAGQLRLVDYDGMFVPGMSRLGLLAAESGLPAYQHPARLRRPDYFDARLDDFAAIVLLLTFAAMTPDRWRRHHSDDNYLLISKRDLLRPKKSVLFQELTASTDAPVRRLTNLLKIATAGTLEAVPPFAEIVSDSAIREVFSSTWKPGLAFRRSSPPVAAASNVPWWQAQAAKRTPRSDQVGVLPLTPLPVAAVLPLRRNGIGKSQPSRSRSSGASLPPPPPSKAAPSGSQAVLRFTRPLTRPTPVPSQAVPIWRRALAVCFLVCVLGAAAAGVVWAKRNADQANAIDYGPRRSEGRQP